MSMMDVVARARIVVADTRWIGLHGIGRFAREVIARLPRVSPLPGSLSLLHPFEAIWLSTLLLRVRPRVYFSPGFNPPLWSPVPLVFTIHDLIHVRFPEETNPRKRAYYHFVVRPATARAYRVLTVSEFSKQEILEWAGLPEEKVVVVGNGVGPEFSPQGKRYEPGYPYVFYVGNTKPHKNFNRLLEAFARSGLLGEVRLVCTGTPSARVRGLIQELGLEKHVVFAGTIPDELLPAYYRGALALILPSLYEGFGLPALEAMACGTPVVTSSVTSLPEVVGDAAVLVDPYDVESIAWGVRRVVEDSSLRKELRRKGLKRAKQFSWDKTAELTWKVLQEAAQEG
ncbi:glycosyltransferase [Thermus thermophilus JL-18]|uniref:Glycosyltransferase n=2 Tax=Thermus thermophilus TaxID=274 RepID=H9ZSJ9_THETH|nr:glycosyltransferase [Thermus thermophilus JL-18]